MLDHEEQASYVLEVKATDSTGNSAMVMVTVRVNDVNDNPGAIVVSTSPLSVRGSASERYEENGTGAVATYTAVGPDAATATWTLEGADRGAFRLEGTSAIRMLMFSRSPDYENPADADSDNVYMVTLRVSDGTNMGTRDVTVTVTDLVNEPMDLMSRYDDNDNAKIDRDEVLDGIEDFFTVPIGSVISREEVLDLIDLFFAGLGS